MKLEFLWVYSFLATISLNPCLCQWLLNRRLYEFMIQYDSLINV